MSKEVYLNASYHLDPMGSGRYRCPWLKGSSVAHANTRQRPFFLERPKKPYKIKLGKKTALIGMPKNKHWALLKPTEDTVAGLQLGKLMGMEWALSFRPVEVVLNGDYIGLYFLTETIRIDENRVNIYEQQDKETNPDLIKGAGLSRLTTIVTKVRLQFLKTTDGTLHYAIIRQKIRQMLNWNGLPTSLRQ